MSAMIYGLTGNNPDLMSEDEWHVAWARTSYYLEHIEMVKFS